MKKLLRKLKQNKGVSLVEVVVSIAVSFLVFLGAVSFIATSTNFFDRQNGTIDLQNELMETSNMVDDSLMESTGFQIFNTSDGGLLVLTGEPDVKGENFTTGKGSARRIEWSKKDSTVHVLDTPNSSVEASIKAGYLIGEHVTNVQITIMDECKINQPDGSFKYSQPLMLKVHIEVSDGDETRSDTKTITLRNELDQVVLYGVLYIKDESTGILYKK